MYGFPGWSVVKNSPANERDMDLIPGAGRFPREGNCNPLQCSCLGSPRQMSLVDYREAKWATLHGAAKESEMTKALKKQQIHLYRGNSSWVMNEKMKRVKLRRGQATVIGTESVIKVGLREGNTTCMQ